MGDFTIVFDFDRTIIDDDSDRWVMTEMGLTPLFNQLRDTLPWNSLMDRMMEELYSQGKTVEDIAECLKCVPLHPRILSAITSAHALGCNLKVLSDANHFFIETILKHRRVYDCFSEIITNPTLVNEEGRLRILPYHGVALPPHNCDLCPPNLCKNGNKSYWVYPQGLEMERIQSCASERSKKTYIYLGDGRGDYCPSLKLGESDHVMPRKDFPLCECISRAPALIKAQVHEWSNGEELEKILLQLIDPTYTKDDIRSVESSQKLSSSPRHEVLPQKIPVPH